MNFKRIHKHPSFTKFVTYESYGMIRWFDAYNSYDTYTSWVRYRKYSIIKWNFTLATIVTLIAN